MNDIDMIDLPPDWGDKLDRMRVIREEIETLDAEYDTLRDEVVVEMTEPVLIAGSDGKKYRVSKVVGSQPVFHLAELHRLTEAQRHAVTETKISGAKLKAEIQAGRIDPMVAMHLVSYQGKRPYPKFDPVE